MKSLFVNLSLITIFVLLPHVNFAGAGDIDLNQAMDTVSLLSGQSASFTTTQTTPFSFHSVGVLSIKNKRLTATFTANTSGASGFWLLTMIGTGKINWYDIGYGFTFPSGGPTAEVDVSRGISFGLATVSVFLTSPVSAETPFKYSIKVAGTAS
jgi:hypothetical protein